MSDATGIRLAVSGPKRRSRLADFFIRLVKEKPLGTVSGIIILIMILVAIFADALAPYRYMEIHLVDRLQGPSARYLLGTDYVGRDFLSRLIHGARLSLPSVWQRPLLMLWSLSCSAALQDSLVVNWTWLCRDLSMPGWLSRDCSCC